MIFTDKIGAFSLPQQLTKTVCLGILNMAMICLPQCWSEKEEEEIRILFDLKGRQTQTIHLLNIDELQLWDSFISDNQNKGLRKQLLTETPCNTQWN